jgi:hypothetical protein
LRHQGRFRAVICKSKTIAIIVPESHMEAVKAAIDRFLTDISVFIRHNPCVLFDETEANETDAKPVATSEGNLLFVLW